MHAFVAQHFSLSLSLTLSLSLSLGFHLPLHQLIQIPTMSRESEPNFANTATVDDLISYLRSTFLSADFQNVAKTLTQREHDMKHRLNQASIEIEKWKKDYSSVEKKHGDLLLKHLSLEDDLIRFKTKFEAMKEKVGVLEERDERREERYSKLVNEVKELDEKNKGLSCSKSKAEADVEVWKKKFKELDVRMSKLEDEASEFFLKNPVIKKELEEIGVCTDLQKGDTNQDSFNLACSNGGATSAHLTGEAENCKITGSSLAGGKAGKWTQSREVIEIDSDDEEPVRDVSTSFMNDHASDLKSNEEKITAKYVAVECSNQTGMVNAEVSLLASNSKRKRADVIKCDQESSDDDMAPTGKQKVKKLGELDSLPQASPLGGNSTTTVSPTSCNPGLGGNIADAASLPSFNPGLGGTNAEFSPTSKPPGFVRRCTEKSEAKLRPLILSDSSDDSSDSDDGNNNDHYIDNYLARIRRQRAKQGWAFEADMLVAFETDDELCLNAVCALHRQRSSNPASFNSRGFQVIDALRGTALAKFLIDGDEQGKVRKSVLELQQFDPNGVDDCRKLAKMHSKQLFDIYQKKEDPFFLPSSLI